MTYEDLYKFTSQFYETVKKKLRETNYNIPELAALKGKKIALEYLTTLFSEYHPYGDLHTALVYKLEETQTRLAAAAAERNNLLKNIINGENDTYKYFLQIINKERQPSQKPRRPYRYPRLHRRE